MDDNDFMEGMNVSRKKHDLVAIKLEDKSEYELPKMGYVQLYNAESDATTWVNSNDPRVQDDYRNAYTRKSEETLKAFKKAGIDSAVINTEENFIIPLVKLFKKR